METSSSSTEYKTIQLENPELDLLLIMCLENNLITEIFYSGLVDSIPDDYETKILSHGIVNNNWVLKLKTELLMSSSTTVIVNSEVGISKSEKETFRVWVYVAGRHKFHFCILKRWKHRHLMMSQLLFLLENSPIYNIDVPLEHSDCMICLETTKKL